MKALNYLVLLFALVLLSSPTFAKESSEHEVDDHIDCTNTKELLENDIDQTILCAKKVLYRKPQLKNDAKVITYEFPDGTLTEYSQVNTIEWPYYPQDQQPDADDIQPFRWAHTVLVYVPKDTQNLSTNSAFLFVGKKKGPVVENKIGNLDELDFQELKFAEIAEELNAVVILQYDNPNQPMRLNGNDAYEDEIMAYTWRKFIENSEKYAYIPIQVAMSASTTEVMTFVQKQVKSVWKIDIPDFVVCGASKRGWATFLASLMDDRVKAILPFVIDVFNLKEQLKGINGNYGNKWPLALFDYNNVSITNYKNFNALHTRNWDRLNQVMDPINYRFQEKYAERISIPKYFIAVSGDDFFLPEGSTLYFKDFPGAENNFIFYLENSGHYVDQERLFPSMISFIKKVTQETPKYPNLEYQYLYQNDGSLTFTATYKCEEGTSCQETDIQAKLWVAENPIARDFRYQCMQEYIAANPGSNIGVYEESNLVLTRVDSSTFSTTVTVNVPVNGYKAAFIQFRDESDFVVTSEIVILRGQNTNPLAIMPQGTFWCTILPTNSAFY